MAQPGSEARTSGEGGESIPFMQQLLDNTFLLLTIGLVMPTVLYVIWGVMEVITIPMAK
jgi:hypothetical protein